MQILNFSTYRGRHSKLAAPPEPLAFEVGYALAHVVNERQGDELLEHIANFRDDIAAEWGLQIPHILVTDNLQLEPSAYVFKIRGVEVTRGHWRSRDPASLAEHLGQIIINHMIDVLDREQVRLMLDGLRTEYPATVEEVTAVLSVGEIRRVLQALLSEEVSIRDLVTIIDSIADSASVHRDIRFMVQQVRCALARQICLQHANADGVLRIVTMSPELEQQLKIEEDQENHGFTSFQENWLVTLNQALDSSTSSDHNPVLMVSTNIRALVKRRTRKTRPRLVCMATAEVSSDVIVESVAEIQSEIVDNFPYCGSTKNRPDDNKASSANRYLTAIESLLLHNDFELEVRRQLHEEVCSHFPLAQRENRAEVHQFIARQIGRKLVMAAPFATNLENVEGPQICTIVGPTGVGKTTVIAKLAAICSLGDNRRVRIVTLDNDGIGARQQIETYAEIIGVPATIVHTAEELRSELSIRVEADIIFVDTEGKSSSDCDRVEEMRAVIETTGHRRTTQLAVSATTKYTDLKETLHRFKPFSLDGMIVTKLDETITIGNVLSILLSSGTPVSYLCDGQKGLQSIKPASVIGLLSSLDKFDLDRNSLEDEFGDRATNITKNKAISSERHLMEPNVCL